MRELYAVITDTLSTTLSLPLTLELLWAIAGGLERLNCPLSSFLERPQCVVVPAAPCPLPPFAFECTGNPAADGSVCPLDASAVGCPAEAPAAHFISPDDIVVGVSIPVPVPGAAAAAAAAALAPAPVEQPMPLGSPELITGRGTNTALSLTPAAVPPLTPTPLLPPPLLPLPQSLPPPLPPSPPGAMVCSPLSMSPASQFNDLLGDCSFWPPDL
eukprot:TRINITY_DN683_c0_g1_i2.p1 TRINITY_DN683_c0_g1~~TRINITY_DN683_c0_g1_i2.p1  ORF type:complete len:235 (-),score=48.12 TRINITY_DN683_c0_g1_i2:676-1320(-)